MRLTCEISYALDFIHAPQLGEDVDTGKVIQRSGGYQWHLLWAGDEILATRAFGQGTLDVQAPKQKARRA